MLIQIEDPARRLADTPDQTDRVLASQGWDRRFTADPQRAGEAMELYRNLGYEVRTEAVRLVEFTAECGGCYEMASQFQTIYTRKRA
jgi:hypothetical protein